MNSSGRHWHSMVIASISTELSSAARRKVSRTRAYRCAPKFCPATAGTANAMAITGRNNACITRPPTPKDRKSTRLNSSHGYISYAVFCLKKKSRCDAVWQMRAEPAGVDVDCRKAAHQCGRVLLDKAHKQVPRSALERFRGRFVEEVECV